MRGRDLHTVCEEAMCPNIHECWEEREATFLILGIECTRRCGFCDVMTAKPDPVDEDEPARIADAVRAMGLRYVVLTGRRARRPPRRRRRGSGPRRSGRSARRCPAAGVEVLPSDFKGGEHDIATRARGRARRVRPQPRDRAAAARADPTGVRLRPVARGAADREAPPARAGHEVEPDPGHGRATRRGRPARCATSSDAGCDILTMGQYLQPPLHLPVDRWVHPEEFAEHARVGEAMGIAHVEAGPLVRSSYHAGAQFQRAMRTASSSRRSADLRTSRAPRGTGGAGL